MILNIALGIALAPIVALVLYVGLLVLWACVEAFCVCVLELWRTAWAHRWKLTLSAVGITVALWAVHISGRANGAILVPWAAYLLWKHRPTRITDTGDHC